MHRERSERAYHTRLGWWVMTHPRGGAALIGSVALPALAADGGYVAHQWRDLDTAFHRAFLLHAPIPIAVVAAGYVFGNHVMFGIVLGGLAFLFGFFVLSSLREIAHPHVTAPRTPKQASS